MADWYTQNAERLSHDYESVSADNLHACPAPLLRASRKLTPRSPGTAKTLEAPALPIMNASPLALSNANSSVIVPASPFGLTERPKLHLK